MNLKAGLWQQQTLKLAMTQELSQAIALLQYSKQELSAFLENKALENPLIQIDYHNVEPINPLIDRNRSRSRHQKVEKNWIEQISHHPLTLEEQLIPQLNLKTISAAKVKVIKYLIQSLDANGYFFGELTEVAEKMNVTLELAKESLADLQALEPAGIGARSLQECLLLQINRANPVNELAQTILSDFFFPFADRKWKQIASELKVSLKEIQTVFDEIQLLNPKPGSMLNGETPAYIIPDVMVEQTSEGLTVRMHDDPIPRISFNERYYHKFKNQDQQVSRFLQDKVQDYQWIIRSMEQRRETLTKVAGKIIEKQLPFFQKGPKYLVPMTMKEIAAELDIHESTVSRAVREKYIQTPVGTFTLKSFFTSSIQTVSEEEGTSSTQVKNAIRQLIEKENKEKPLSDQDIVEQLKLLDGIVVSRRTVAKYRDQLGIPSSTKRKRF